MSHDVNPPRRVSPQLRGAWPARTLCLALVVLSSCTAPPPESTRARHDASISQWFALYWKKEQQRPERAQATLQRLGRYLAGNPENAQKTAVKILELD